MSAALVADPRVVRFLRRQDETREVLDGVRAAAHRLNIALEAAAELGLDAEVKTVIRRNATGAKFAEVIPSLFLNREKS